MDSDACGALTCEAMPATHRVAVCLAGPTGWDTFGMPDRRLTLRHDAGGSAKPYVDGALIAIRRVSTLVGVHRGLDVVLDL